MPFEVSESKSEGIKRMKESLSNLETEHGRMLGAGQQAGQQAEQPVPSVHAGYNFRPEPTDVMLVTPPKCGTTWVCQIVHSLRTRGDMSFGEINEVIPCLEMAYDSGITDLSAPQVAVPRVFKTHFWRPHCPKGAGRYVFTVRDPLETGPSFYHFMMHWFFDPGQVSMDEFLAEFYLARGQPTSPMQNASHWHNLLSWFPLRSDPNVLWLHYEDLHEDLPAAVALIANFLGIGADDAELQRIAVEQSSIEHMRKYPEKYDEHLLKRARNEACGRPADAGMGRTQSTKVRSGVLGRNRQELSHAMRTAIQAKWEEVVAPVTGYASYEALRAGINLELGRPFGRRAAA